MRIYSKPRPSRLWLFVIVYAVCKSNANSDIGLLPQEGKVSEETLLLTTLCTDSTCLCDDDDCKSYLTPMSTCYNGQQLFPLDPSWGELDIWDELLTDLEFRRSFFPSRNVTCSAPRTDVYTLPLNECVGPFGRPKPWGRFSCVSSTIGS
jgi:hypothetical protein